MIDLQVRRLASGQDTILDQGRAPYRKAWAAAVVAHPSSVSSGKADLAALSALGEELGHQLGEAALAALGEPLDKLAYGKGAIVGTDSDIEQAAALLHPRLGRPLRELINQGKAIIPSTIKQGPPGCRLDVPLHGAEDEWDFALLDSLEVALPGAPLAGEIVVFVVLAHGGRAFAKVTSR